MDQATVYADIVKVEKDPVNPAYRLVHSRISDETKDLDGQRADYDWLKEALPDWFKYGNVRDMHENNVVGKGKELTDLGPQVRGFDGILKVVDPTAVMKLDEELFTGVSIGIKGPRVMNEKGAQVHPTQPGWIKGGKIVEISLVDHPCNESCKLTVLKGVGGGLTIVKGAKLEILNKAAFADVIKLSGAYWFKRAKWNTAARHEATASGHAMAGGRFPIDDASDVSDAVHLYNTGHGQTPDVKEHIISRAKALGQGNPFKKKNQTKIADRVVTPTDLATYQKRFSPAFASQGLSLSDGSYVIVDEGDLFLAKGLALTGFGNVTAANALIKRREEELLGKDATPNGGCGCCDKCAGDCDGTCCDSCKMGSKKAAGATQQATPSLAEHPTAPGARSDRDSGNPNVKSNAVNPPAKASDKDTPAHQSPAASGSEAAENDTPASGHGHPNRIPKQKKQGMGGKKKKLGHMNHGDNTGAQGSHTDTSKAPRVVQTHKIKTKWLKKFSTGDPAEWSDKDLSRALDALSQHLGETETSEITKAVSNSAQSGPDNRSVIEQIARNMQGRIYDIAQATTAPVTDGTDKPKREGDNDLLAQGALMRDGDPRVGHANPATALGQSGPMDGGNARVSDSPNSGAPNTSLPLDSAPQPGGTSQRTSPGNLPGTLAAPGDASPVISDGGPGGGGGNTSAAPAQRAATPAAQSGPDPNAGHRTGSSSPNTSFPWPDRQPSPGGSASGTGASASGVARRKSAKPGKKDKWLKKMNKLGGTSTPKLVEADSIKAVVADVLKRFVKDLEKTVLVKYATADQLKALQEDIDKLGRMAQPGGPFLGKISAADKEFAANAFAVPSETIAPQVLERMERYDRLSKSDNRKLAASAQAELTKMLSEHFPGRENEITQTLEKNSSAKRKG